MTRIRKRVERLEARQPPNSSQTLREIWFAGVCPETGKKTMRTLYWRAPCANERQER